MTDTAREWTGSTASRLALVVGEQCCCCVEVLRVGSGFYEWNDGREIEGEGNIRSADVAENQIRDRYAQREEREEVRLLGEEEIACRCLREDRWKFAIETHLQCEDRSRLIHDGCKDDFRAADILGHRFLQLCTALFDFGNGLLTNARFFRRDRDRHHRAENDRENAEEQDHL